jgi:hypothetical protein
MGFGKINVWMRDRRDCSALVSANGVVTVIQCCGKEVKKGDLINGHCELVVPPGCYIVTAQLKEYKHIYENMVIVGCDRSSCINFLFVKE